MEPTNIPRVSAVLNIPIVAIIDTNSDPDGVNYPLTLENKARNYVLEFIELCLDLQPIYDNFHRLQK